MKRLALTLFLLAGSLLCASRADAAPAFVQKTDQVCNAGFTPATTCVMSSLTTTMGNVLVIGAGWFTPAVNLSVTDTSGNIWNCISLPKRANQGGGESFQMCYALSIAGGADVATLTWSGSGSTFSGAIEAEYSGVNAIDGYDTSNDTLSNTAIAGNSTAPASQYASANHDTTELAIGFAIQATNYNWTAGSGYTLRSTATSFQLGLEDQNVTNGTYQATFSTSGLNNWGAIQLVLYDTGASQFVQQVDQALVSGSQSTPSATTYWLNTTSGSLLFCTALWANNVTVSGVTDSQSNRFHLLPRISLPGGAAYQQAFYALGTAGGADSVSIAWNSGGATFIEQSCQEYSGVSSIDQHAEGTAAASMSAASPSVTTVVNNELLIGYGGTSSDQPLAAVSPWTSRTTSNRAIMVESQFLQPTGTYTASFTNSSLVIWNAGIVTFFAGNSSPHILTGNNTVCFIAEACSFEVDASGTPVPSITMTGGVLPSGMTFTDNGDGTATLAGTPAMGTTGLYSLTFTAHNIVMPDSVQPFTLRVVPDTLVQEQDQKCNITGTPATSCTFTLTNGSGNMMFLEGAWLTNVTMSVADTKGNSWKCLSRRVTLSGTVYVQACYALGIANGSNTVTATWSGSGATFSASAIGEWSGVNAFEDYDQQDNVSYYAGNSAEASNPNSYTSATHDGTELAIGYASYSAFTSWSAGGNWTLRSTPSNVQLSLEDQIVPNGSYTEDFQMGTPNGWVAGLAIFYQTDGAQFVQANDHDDGVPTPATPDIVPYFVNVTAGDFLLSVYGGVNSPPPTVNVPTDTVGTAFTCDTQLTMADGVTWTRACHGFAGGTGADTVTQSFSGSGASWWTMWHSEWSGVNTIDQSAQQTGTSTTAQSPSVTTSHPNELIIGWYVTAAGFQTWSIPPQWTARGTNVRSEGAESQYLQPPGAYNSSFTTGNANWAAGIITLYSSSGTAIHSHRVTNQ